METLLAFVVLITLVLTPISFVVFLIQKIRKKPNAKKWGLIALVSLIVFFVSAILMPTCEHEWVEANCETPKTCTLCEATEGEALGHEWLEATCDKPMICAVCQAEEGTALGHDMVDASCELAKHCSRCELTEGKALGHEWAKATCSLAKTCAVCAKSEGDPLGHDFSKMEVVKKATCTETGYAEGVCARCEENTSQEIAMIDHKMGKWATTEKATCTSDGQKEQKCSVCGYVNVETIAATGHTESEWKVTEKAGYSTAGTRAIVCTKCDEVLKSESYELNEKEKEAAFKKMCEKVKYDTLARYPKDYLLKPLYFKGKVVQAIEKNDGYVLRVNVTKGSYSIWRDTVWVEYTPENNNRGRILEDDIITFYGYGADTISYETVMGATVTIPAVLAMYVDY